MIDLVTLAEKYQDDLNAVIESNGDLWRFRIFAQTGRTKPPERDGNEIEEHIEAQLSYSSSAKEANLLVMGINYLTLEFLIPEEPFHTSSEQSADDLLTVDSNGQNYFVNYVSQIITDYFQTATASTMTDSDGTSYGISQKAGVAIGGLVDISADFGRAVPVSVSIEISFVEGGTNALDIELYIDGVRVPYQSLVPSRAFQLDTNVSSDSVYQKHHATSTAFGLDITFPSTSSSIVATLMSEFTGGSINMAHFVRLVWGDLSDNSYLMTVTSMNTKAEGASFAGVNISLGEITGDLSLCEFPDNFSVYALKYSSSTDGYIKFTGTAKTVFKFKSSAYVTTQVSAYNLCGYTQPLYYTAGTGAANDDGTVPVTFSVGLNHTLTDFQSYFIDTITDAESDTYEYSVYIVVLGSITFTTTNADSVETIVAGTGIVDLT